MTYPDGRKVKNSRAANFIWKIGEGKYLYWFQNCSYKGYYPRNPAWICAALEQDTQLGKKLFLSQPEILLYHEKEDIGFSYPDLLIDNDMYYISETQKTIARIHEIPSKFVQMIFSQFGIDDVEKNLLLYTTLKSIKMPNKATNITGIILEFLINYKGKQTLFSNLTDDGQGAEVKVKEDGQLEINFHGLDKSSHIKTRSGLLHDKLHHLCIIIDVSSHLIYFVVDGIVEDGGDQNIYGWHKFNKKITNINGASMACLGKDVKCFRLYGKALSTTECIGNWRVTKKLNVKNEKSN